MDTLPQDIHYVVLDQFSDDPTQILEFTLVCKSWMSYCRNLYGTLYPFRILVSMSQQPNRALDALLPPASLIRNYVRHLRIVGPEVTPTCSKSRVRPPLYELYVNLAHELLQLHGLILPLRTLGFDHVNWSNWPRSMYTELVQVLSTSCTRLITLDFSHSKFNGPTIPLSFQLNFPFIRSLYLRDCVMTHELPLTSAQSLHTSYGPNLTSLVLEGDLDFTLLMLRGLLTCPSFTTHLTICTSWDEAASQALQDFLKHLGSVLRFLKVGLLRGSDDDFPISLEHNTELVTLYLGLSGPEIVGQPYPCLIRMIESLASPSFMKLFLDFTQVSSANTLESVFKRMVDWSSLERVLIERHSMRHLPLVHLWLPSSPHLEISKWVESLLSTIHREGKLVVLQEN